jgi:hypothetical protein
MKKFIFYLKIPREHVKNTFLLAKKNFRRVAKLDKKLLP